MLRSMTADDFVWAGGLMERRRERYAAYSPLFWRPSSGATDGHAQFMRSLAERDGTVAMRSDAGFLIAIPQDGRLVVDDFAVEDDAQWDDEGRTLLLSAWAATPTPLDRIRVVTARKDEPKRGMLRSLGLAVTARWWVKELDAAAGDGAWGPVTVAELPALMVPAPPVYDPGGPVCILGDVDAAHAVVAAEEAAALGAVIAVVQREGDPAPSEPVLERAGFHNPSEFFEGVPELAKG